MQLQALGLNGYDSIKLSAPSQLLLFKNADTVKVGWHDACMTLPRYDSLSFRIQRLGTRWQNARLQLRWDLPVRNAYEGALTRVHLEAFESDGSKKTIDADVTLSNTLQTSSNWARYSSTVTR